MYRNYHARISTGTHGDTTAIERSVYVFDIGEGTKRVARELVRAEFGARRVSLKRGRIVAAPRAGTPLTFDEKAMRSGLTAVNKATASYNAAKAKGDYKPSRIGKAKTRAPRPVEAKAKATTSKARKAKGGRSRNADGTFAKAA